MTEDLIKHSYEERRQKLMRALKSYADDLEEYRRGPKPNPQAIAARERLLNRFADFIEDTDSAVFQLIDLTAQRYLEGIKAGRHRNHVEDEEEWETTLSREGQREIIRKRTMAKWPELYGRDPQSHNEATKPQLVETYQEISQLLKQMQQ